MLLIPNGARQIRSFGHCGSKSQQDHKYTNAGRVLPHPWDSAATNAPVFSCCFVWLLRFILPLRLCIPFCTRANQFFASVVCGSGIASSAAISSFVCSHSGKQFPERKLGTWLLSGTGCFGSRLEHLYSSVVQERQDFENDLLGHMSAVNKQGSERL